MRTSAALLMATVAWIAPEPARADGANAPEVDVVDTRRGWVGVQQRDVFGLATSSSGRATQDYGVDALGGLWLLGQHLQPIFDIGWSHVFGPTVVAAIDVFRVGTRVAFGGALLDDRLWLGGAAGFVVETGWRRVTESALSSSSSSTSSPTLSNTGSTANAPSLAWAISPSISALAQGRFARRLLVGGELGLERAIPNLAWGTSSIFNSFRLQVALELGVILGDPI
jgi:hypothetical protein